MLFSLKENLFFFNLTNTYFKGEAKGNPKAQFGWPNEKRTDCQLVTMSIIADEREFVKYGKLFPGNKTEGEILSDMIKVLGENLLPSTVIKPLS